MSYTRGFSLLTDDEREEDRINVTIGSSDVTFKRGDVVNVGHVGASGGYTVGIDNGFYGIVDDPCYHERSGEYFYK